MVSSVWSSSLSFYAGPGAWYEPPGPVGLEVPVLRREPAEDCLRQAQAALRQGAFEAALGWFSHAAALRPSLPLAHVGRAICLLRLDRDQEAGDALGAAYEASAGPGETDLLLARLCAIGGERAAALRQLGEALAAAPLLADLVREDDAFRGLRDHPQFLQVLGDL